MLSSAECAANRCSRKVELLKSSSAVLILKPAELIRRTKWGTFSTHDSRNSTTVLLKSWDFTLVRARETRRKVVRYIHGNSLVASCNRSGFAEINEDTAGRESRQTESHKSNKMRVAEQRNNRATEMRSGIESFRLFKTATDRFRNNPSK